MRVMDSDPTSINTGDYHFLHGDGLRLRLTTIRDQNRDRNRDQRRTPGDPPRAFAGLPKVALLARTVTARYLWRASVVSSTCLSWSLSTAGWRFDSSRQLHISLQLTSLLMRLMLTIVDVLSKDAAIQRLRIKTIACVLYDSPTQIVRRRKRSVPARAVLDTQQAWRFLLANSGLPLHMLPLFSIPLNNFSRHSIQYHHRS